MEMAGQVFMNWINQRAAGELAAPFGCRSEAHMPGRDSSILSCWVSVHQLVDMC